MQVLILSLIKPMQINECGYQTWFINKYVAKYGVGDLPCFTVTFLVFVYDILIQIFLVRNTQAISAFTLASHLHVIQTAIYTVRMKGMEHIREQG